jgi:GABA(A) receptor-associated protein
MDTFKKEFTFEQRHEEASRIRAKYPDRVPVIVEKVGENFPQLDKKKFLVPDGLTIGQFLHVVRKRIDLGPEKALFLSVNGCMPSSSSTMKEVYNTNKEKDMFAYLLVSLHSENTFG